MSCSATIPPEHHPPVALHPWQAVLAGVEGSRVVPVRVTLEELPAIIAAF